MRLSPEEVEAIKAAAVEAFGENAVVRLFGSRLNDALAGGDVDLHVEVDARADCDDQRWQMQRRLFGTLDHDKVDLIVTQRGSTPRGFERLAYRDGAVL